MKFFNETWEITEKLKGKTVYDRFGKMYELKKQENSQ